MGDDRSGGPETARSRVGCLLIGRSGGWVAACRDLNFQVEGVGDIGGLPSDALWIVNRDSGGVAELRRANRGLKLVMDGWMRVTLGDMSREWGIGNVRNTVRARIMAWALGRVLNVALEAALESGFASDLSPAEVRAVVEGAPSLAAGLRHLYWKQLDANIPGGGLGGLIARSLTHGVSRAWERDVRDGEFPIQCRFPALGHGIRVTSGDVPGAGNWRKLDFSPGEPLEARVSALRRLDLPILIIGDIKRRPGMPHDYLSQWVGSGEAGKPRSVYTLDEAAALLPWYRFEEYSALAGPGWRKSLTGRMMEGLVRVCGGRRAAAASWSANAAAENILRSGMRQLGGRRDGLSPDCFWLSARDRLGMARPIQALRDCGATLVSAHAGTITVKTAEDPDAMAEAVETMWNYGLHVPVGTVRRMRALGADIQPDPSVYGGPPEDIVLGSMSLRGLPAMMWRFDEILDRRGDERAAAFAALSG